MIQATDLRINNLVDILNESGYISPDTGYNWTVTMISTLDVWVSKNGGEKMVKIKNLSPITLTEEWLKNMGMPEDRSTIDLFNWELYFERRDGKLYLSTEQASPGRLIEYLHIAQNIHNSLTNKDMQS